MNNSRKIWSFAVATIALVAGQAVVAQEIVSGAPEDISITIYNQNFGLVREKRSVALKSGITYVRVEDVAANIDPTTVSFQSLTAPNAVAVREQNYQYDLIDPATVLSKSVGKQVKFKQYLPGGQVKELEGILLNPSRVTITDSNGGLSTTEQGLVLKTSDGIILNPEGQAELKELPSGLVAKPSLLWKLETEKQGTHSTEIRYQTSGINWKCDYVAVLNDKDDHSDLTSWVTIDNKSGASYKSAALKLLAGDVHKLPPASLPPPPPAMRMMEMAAAPAPQFREQAFAEYHLYSLQGRTTVADNEIKQLSLFNAADIPVKKLFLYEAGDVGYYGNQISDQKVNVKIELVNSDQNHLGMPMPKGKVRVYKKDQDGALQFVGEDSIDHTPKDEKVRLYVGDAFDLVGEHKQTNFQQISNHAQRSSYEIELRNHKKEDVTITCVEHGNGDWTILNSTQPYKKKDSHTFEFAINVPANGSSKLTYEIETRY